MEFKNILESRRAINFFDPHKDVDDEQLQHIVEAAAKTPSSFNLQPWKIVIFRDKNQKQILRELAIEPGQTVVDAGCGNGYMTMLFAQQVESAGKVYALDLNIDVFTSTFPDPLPANVSVMQCDMTVNIPLVEASVDLVYTATVIHSLPREKVADLVCEVRRVIRPGGVLAVVEMAKHDTAFGPPFWQRYSSDELQQAFPFDPVKTVAVAEHFYMQLFRVQPE